MGYGKVGFGKGLFRVWSGAVRLGSAWLGKVRYGRVRLGLVRYSKGLFAVMFGVVG